MTYVDYSIGEAARFEPGAPGRYEQGSGERPPLSKAHIRPLDWPSVHWCEGASILTVSKGGRCDATGGGQRGYIKGFSDDSRRRLLVRIGMVRRDAPLPDFVTLTWPNLFPAVATAKKQFNAWMRRLKRRFPGVGLVWKIEPQQRGAPHYHMLIWGADLDELREFVPLSWFEIAGGGDTLHLRWHMGLLGNGNQHCVQPVRTWRGVWAYAAKYLGKTFEVEGWGNIGRYWGIINPGNIPFGKMRYSMVQRHTAYTIQRYQRRFGHLRPRGRSVTLFCDAEQWVDNCLGQGRKSSDTECLVEASKSAIQ